MSGDTELLRRYVEERSEAAFAELVRLHLNLVYFAALRQVGGDVHRAQDVTQGVFTDLARKAATLTGRPTLTGWLHTSTRFAAAKVRRADLSRQKRDQEAETMHALLHDDDASTAEWERLRPMIDDVVHELGDRDREAVLLRFFEGRPFAEIGVTLGLSEDAARMRVDRALDRLRGALARRGVASTTGALAVVFANQVSAMAPANLSVTVASTALAAAGSGAAAGMLTAVGATKIALAFAAVVLVGGTVAFVMRRETPPPHPPVATRSPLAAAALAPLPGVSAGTSSPSVASTSAGAPRMEWSSPAELTRAGRATPRDALETLLLALVEGDVDTIANAICLGPKAREKAESQLARLPEEGRMKFGPPERFLALKIVGSVPEMIPRIGVIRVLGQTEIDAGTTALRVQMQEFGGLVHEEELPFERSAGGWRFKLPEK